MDGIEQQPIATSMLSAPAVQPEQMGLLTQACCCLLNIIIQTQAPAQDAAKLPAARSWQDMPRGRNTPPCYLFSSQLLYFIVLTELPWKDELTSSLKAVRSH